FAKAHYHRGITSRDMGRLAEAVAGYDRALDLGGEDAEILSSRGIALWEMGEPDQALASFDRALALDPKNVEAWNNRGNLLARAGIADEALVSYDKALALKPDHVQALRNRAGLLWDALGRYDDAVRDFETVMALDPAQEYLRADLLHLRMAAADWQDYDR